MEAQGENEKYIKTRKPRTRTIGKQKKRTRLVGFKPKKYPKDRPADVSQYLYDIARFMNDEELLREIKRMRRCGPAKGQGYLKVLREQMAAVSQIQTLIDKNPQLVSISPTPGAQPNSSDATMPEGAESDDDDENEENKDSDEEEEMSDSDVESQEEEK